MQLYCLLRVDFKLSVDVNGSQIIVSLLAQAYLNLMVLLCRPCTSVTMPTAFLNRQMRFHQPPIIQLQTLQNQYSCGLQALFLHRSRFNTIETSAKAHGSTFSIANSRTRDRMDVASVWTSFILWRSLETIAVTVAYKRAKD